MKIFDFIKKLIFGDPNSYEKIMEKRSTLKDEIRESLRGINFTGAEINEVLSVVDNAEKKINDLKARLVGSNITVSKEGEEAHSPKDYMDGIQNQIQHEIQKMNVDLREKVKEIQQRKSFRLN